MEEETLKEQVKRLSQAIEEQKQDENKSKDKVKKFRLPQRAKLNKSKLKKNYTTIAFINENKEVNFTRQQIKEGTVMINNCPYLATPDYMMTFKGKPLLIIPSWTIEPFSPQKNMDEAAEKQKLTVGYRLLLNAMKSEVIAAKKSMNIIFIVIGLIVLGVAAYFLITKSGGFHF